MIELAMSIARVARRARVLMPSLAIFAALPLGAGTRVVAVGDVHGDIDGLSAILRECDLIDSESRWIGGTTALVQTGDLLDRGAAVREVMDLLMELQPQAAAVGGKVVVLLGNHEAMNLLGILRDVNGDAYSSFVTESSEELRVQGYQAFCSWWQRRGARLGLDTSLSPEVEPQWMAIRPAGMLEYSHALGPEGVYGRWLRLLQAAVVIDDSLFVHGAFGTLIAGMTVEEVNRKVADELATFDKLRAYMTDEGLSLPWHSIYDLAVEVTEEIAATDGGEPAASAVDQDRALRARRLQPLADWEQWFLVRLDGPLWLRLPSNNADNGFGGQVAAILDALGVRRMVVGHTPQPPGRIRSHFENRLFAIDTGMLASVYGGQPSALEILDGTVTAIYLDERQVLESTNDSFPEPPSPVAVTTPPPS